MINHLLISTRGKLNTNGRRRTISTSKIKKIIVIKKNRKENGNREAELGSNPHSKGEDFSRLKIVFLAKIRDRIITTALTTRSANKSGTYCTGALCASAQCTAMLSAMMGLLHLSLSGTMHTPRPLLVARVKSVRMAAAFIARRTRRRRTERCLASGRQCARSDACAPSPAPSAPQ